MSFLAQRPLLVSVFGTIAEGHRHVHVRTFLVDEIEASLAYQGLLGTWDEPALSALATDARSALELFLSRTGLPLDEVGFAIGGRLVGRTVKGRHGLDEPGPPVDRTVQIGAFVDKLLTEGATTDELAELMAAPDRMPPGSMHLDLRTPRPLGTVLETVAIDYSKQGRALRAPLEDVLGKLDDAWGDVRARRQQALAFVESVRLDRWSFLADDLVLRFGASLASAVRGDVPRWEFRIGSRQTNLSPVEGLDIPAFTPSGNILADRARLRRWRTRLEEIEGVIEQATRPASPDPRPVRGNELRGYRRGVRWLYQNHQGRQSLSRIALNDLGSRDRWRDVQRTLRRVRTLLDAGNDARGPS